LRSTRRRAVVELIQNYAHSEKQTALYEAQTPAAQLGRETATALLCEAVGADHILLPFLGTKQQTDGYRVAAGLNKIHNFNAHRKDFCQVVVNVFGC
jgi:hypothetical protein